MRQDVRRSVLQAARNGDNIADLFRDLDRRYATYFDTMADTALSPIMDSVVKESGVNLQQSIPAEAGIVIGELTPAAQKVVDEVFKNGNEMLRQFSKSYLNQLQPVVSSFVSGTGDLNTIQDLVKSMKIIKDDSDEAVHRASMDLVRSAYQGVTVERARSVGSTVGIWVHTYGHGKYPRINHEKANGEEFDLATGEFLTGPFKGQGCGYGAHDNKMVLPGQPRYCHCTFRIKVDFGVE